MKTKTTIFVKKISLILYVVLVVPFISIAQITHDFVQDFGPTSGFNGTGEIVALQQDGKMIVGGRFSSYNGINEYFIVRLNTDGTKDVSFKSESGLNWFPKAIAVQEDGKIIVGGYFTSYNGVTANFIIRLNSDGSNDSTFNTGTGFNSTVLSIVIQPDGKIIVGGEFTSFNGFTENRIVRLNSDGTKDSSFITGTGFSPDYNGLNVKAIVLQPDGKIIAGGSFIDYNGEIVQQRKIIRLNNNGTIDHTFNSGNGFSGDVLSIVMQPDGKIIVGGKFQLYNGATARRIIRLNSNGTKDNTFQNEGFDNDVHSIVLLPDGEIIVGGIFGIFLEVHKKTISY